MPQQWRTCPRCAGTGIVMIKVGRNRFEVTCPTCGGSGKVSQ